MRSRLVSPAIRLVLCDPRVYSTGHRARPHYVTTSLRCTGRGRRPPRPAAPRCAPSPRGPRAPRRRRNSPHRGHVSAPARPRHPRARRRPVHLVRRLRVRDERGDVREAPPHTSHTSLAAVAALLSGALAAAASRMRALAADALAAMEPDAAAAKGEDVDVLPFARLRSSQACLSGNLCVMQTSVPQPRHRYAFTAVSFSLHRGAPQRFDLLGCLFGSHEVDECRSKVTWMLSPGTCLTLLPHSGHTTHVVSCAYRWHRRQRQIWFSGDIRCKYAPARRSRIRGRSCGPGRRSARIPCTQRAESPAGRIRGTHNSRRASVSPSRGTNLTPR